jgi:hypothetical protein
LLTFDAAGSAIVLVGSFNPAIFQPAWFAKLGLLSEETTKKAEVKIITPQVCHFETDEFVLQVVDQRFLVQSKMSADPAPLSDLVSGTFFILEHTPVTAMGLNRQMHVDLQSEEAWHRFGDRLVPKDGWKSVLDGRPGMVGVAVQSPMKDFPNALFTMRIEPSQRLKHGAYFDTNENYSAQADEPEPLKRLMQILKTRWEKVEPYATNVAEHILTWAKADK